MKNKVSRNLLMTVLLTIFVVAILGISFAYTTIYQSVSTDDYVSFNHIDKFISVPETISEAEALCSFTNTTMGMSASLALFLVL